MDRRKFLQTIGAAGAVGLQPPQVLAGSVEVPRPLPPGLSDASSKVLLELANEFISISVFSDGTANIVDRKSGAQWRMGPVALQDESEIEVGAVWVRSERSVCEQYPGRFRGRREGKNIRFWVIGRDEQPKGSFLVGITLDGPWLEFRLLEIDEQLPSLSFPPSIESTSLVLPMHLGRWIQKPVAGRFFYPFFSHLNMRWFGGLNGDRSWMALFSEENFVDSGVMLTEMTAAPTWLKQRGRWAQPRAVRYRFVAGNYVTLARTYREWAIENGIHRDLKSKLVATPALTNLLRGRMVSMVEATPRHGKEYDQNVMRPWKVDPMLGAGPEVSFTHDQALECVRALPGAGINHALVVVRGWIPGGYDYSHPDVWPPEPKLGTIDDLKRLCAASSGFTVGLHDNYQDMYVQCKSWPHGLNIERNRERMPGGYWAGGQAYIINAHDGLEYARRNWRLLGQLNLRAYFVDTTSAVQMYQSYQQGNTLTRSQDMANKIEMLRFFKSQGVVLGSEEGADFAVPYLDWNENRHTRQPGESVPLWPLVFHDAVVAGRYTGGDASSFAGVTPSSSGYPLWLEDMLWGYAAYSSIQNYAERDAALRGMAGKWHLDAWFPQISTADMRDHRFLGGDYSLEQTFFSNGKSIIVNFADHPQSHAGTDIPAHGYTILDHVG
jgi:hypothetical protein